MAGVQQEPSLLLLLLLLPIADCVSLVKLRASTTTHLPAAAAAAALAVHTAAAKALLPLQHRLQIQQRLCGVASEPAVLRRCGGPKPPPPPHPALKHRGGPGYKGTTTHTPAVLEARGVEIAVGIAAVGAAAVGAAAVGGCAAVGAAAAGAAFSTVWPTSIRRGAAAISAVWSTDIKRGTGVAATGR